MTSKQGWILRIQKFRAGIDLLLSCANLLQNVLYHVNVQMKIREIRLQNGIFVYKEGLLRYKRDSRSTFHPFLFTYQVYLLTNLPISINRFICTKIEVE